MSSNTNNNHISLIQSLNNLSIENSQSPNPKPDYRRSLIAKEEIKIGREIIRAITTGKSETLKPNSGEAVSIDEHYICVSVRDERDTDCRLWEWHGHVAVYDEEKGFSQEYVYGNHYERLYTNVNDFDDEFEYGEDDESEEIQLNLGLHGLMGGSVLGLMNDRMFRRI